MADSRPPSMQDIHDISDYFRGKLSHVDPAVVESILWGAESEAKSATEICKTLQVEANNEQVLSTVDKAVYLVINALPEELYAHANRPPISGEPVWTRCKDIQIVENKDKSKGKNENKDTKKTLDLFEVVVYPNEAREKRFLEKDEGAKRLTAAINEELSRPGMLGREWRQTHTVRAWHQMSVYQWELLNTISACTKVFPNGLPANRLEPAPTFPATGTLVASQRSGTLDQH